jgi:hypothetical protein
MLQIPDTYPIIFHPSWEILDSTKLKCFEECHRKFFYENLLGWKPEQPSIDLIFGEAIHEALAVIHEAQDLGDETLALAYTAFIKCYQETFPANTWEDYVPKNPEGALAILTRYADHYGDDFQKAKTKYVEVGGSVPIQLDPIERRMHFRLDGLMEDLKENYFCREHKTTGSNFSRMWRDEFDLSIQIGTYNHAQYCIFPKERVRGVEVNGISIRGLKSGPAVDFERKQCWSTPAQMNQWLWTVNDLWSTIEFELDRLSACKDSDPVLCAFPINPYSCTKYRGCIYHDFCVAWANPLQQHRQPPPGFKVEFWDPSKEEYKTKMELEWRD